MTGRETLDRMPSATHEPLVSIVTPTLNQGQFIGATIQSIKAQRYRNVEHIIVDGGSTDETLDIVRLHEGTYPMRWISEPDGGMYDAVNKGIRLARGEILAYLNSDDVYFPWTIDTVVAAFASGRPIDIAFGDGIHVDDETGAQHLMLLPPFTKSSLAILGSLVQPAAFWHRTVLDASGGFDPSLRYVGDLDFWLRAAKPGRVVHIDEVLAVERGHAARLSVAAADRIALEDLAMRGRHGGGSTASPRARRRARMRNRWWRRAPWIRLLVSVHMPRASEWQHFRREADPAISTRRILLGMLPRVGSGYLERAVTSDLALRLLQPGMTDTRPSSDGVV